MRSRYASAGLLLWRCLGLWLRLLFLGEVLAGLLIDRFHRKADLAAIVEAEQLHFHAVAFLHNITGLRDTARRELGDMNQTVARAEEVHEGTEVHHLHDLA